MTTFPDADPVVVPAPAGPHTARLALVGDLDYDTCGELLEQVRVLLHDREDVEELRLDCLRLDLADSTGLATLLQIHRTTCEEGIGFHLDNIGPALSRLLRITGTYEHLTSSGRAEPPPGK